VPARESEPKADGVALARRPGGLVGEGELDVAWGLERAVEVEVVARLAKGGAVKVVADAAEGREEIGREVVVPKQGEEATQLQFSKAVTAQLGDDVEQLRLDGRVGVLTN